VQAVVHGEMCSATKLMVHCAVSTLRRKKKLSSAVSGQSKKQAKNKQKAAELQKNH
jgi:hypothetical protein